MKVGFLVAGFKGYNFLESLHRDCHIEFVASYKSKGTINCFFDNIQSICLKNGYSFFERHELNYEVFALADIIFISGWQYIIDKPDDKFVVFHDSLLPRFRGFAPTVSALILGEKEIGVTALKPSNIIDRGDIYEQKSIDIYYPIKIKDAYLLLANCYTEIARSILDKAAKESLILFPQDESQSTYSIWRDEDDYYLNWNWDSEKICRFIDAVGWPYDGARTIYKSKLIYIDDVAIVQDRNFEERHPGKIWCLNQGFPEVVCGKGMVQILSARNEDGSPVIFDRLRERLTRK